ncbi:MAG TPA: HAMP domain-containing sensor histidine kinase [Gammaproteobacteria bacterium]|nr:HAMP domain-containing sensor histidine kinase [Gammaproteobacteria bacterium]
MLNSLYFKLVLVLFCLFIVIGGVFLAVVLYTAPMYQQEVSQRLNHDLAHYIVKEHVLIRDGVVQHDNLEKLFHDVMIINPSLELYLLDAKGRLVAHSLEPDRIVRKQVSLLPINEFLENPDHGLILGDDPVHKDGVNSFTVAPIDFGNQRQGYIYAILGSEKINRITDVLQRSLIMKWSTSTILIALAFAFAAGLVLFFILMRKLRVLSQAMQDFKQSNLMDLEEADSPDRRAGDEIDAMALTFREMAQRIKTQVNHLQEVEAMRRELVANVSHDLRTPLSSLNGFLETLQLKSAVLSDEEKQTYLKIACDNAARLRHLVEELFELAKLDANEVQPQQEQFSLAELSFDISHQFYLRAREKNIDFEVIADEAVPFVNADLGMIERVLENLIENSFKHTPARGRIQLRLTPRGDSVEIEVSDTGHGISREELPHVLKRFYRNRNLRDESDNGLGLGLAIASRIVELHGGRLTVDSELHRGTIFRFSLPIGSRPD